MTDFEKELRKFAQINFLRTAPIFDNFDPQALSSNNRIRIFLSKSPRKNYLKVAKITLPKFEITKFIRFQTNSIKQLNSNIAMTNN